MEINKEKVIELLRKKEKFLQGHVHPDGDDIASLCALRDALLLMGRQADMPLEDPVPDRYAFLPAASEIRRTIPENGGYDLIVFTDLSNLERAGSFDFPKTETLCIDHHISNTGYTDYLFLCPQYAATAEILTELFLTEAYRSLADMANALYMGIATDSGFFKYSNTSPHTLLMAKPACRRRRTSRRDLWSSGCRFPAGAGSQLSLKHFILKVGKDRHRLHE